MIKRKMFPYLMAAALVASTFAPMASVNGQTMSMKSITYPKTAKVSHVDDYAGTKIEDPYRWLEDDRSKETEAWVTAQNKVTFGYLEGIPFRAALRARLGKLYDYPKYSAPSEKRGLYFFRKNTGLQNQAVLYIQKGLDGTPEVLIDPNALSPDGTTRLGATIDLLPAGGYERQYYGSGGWRGRGDGMPDAEWRGVGGGASGFRRRASRPACQAGGRRAGRAHWYWM